MPRRLVIGPDAVEVWTQFHNHVEEQCGAGSDLHSIRDFGSKASEHAARLSGVLTIVEDPSASTISVTAMERGTTLADWYVAEALRLQQRSRSDARLVRAQSLYDWMTRHLDERHETSITFREILQNAPASFRTKAPADEAIRTLLDHQRVADLPGPPRTITPVRTSQ